MSDMWIVVILNDANPELLNEFEKISTRSRAERMRVLVTLGLKLVGGTSNMGNQKLTVELSIQPTNRIQVVPKATKVKSSSVNSDEAALVAEQTKTDEGIAPSNTVDTEITNPPPDNSSRRNSRVAKFARSLGAG